MLRTYIKLNILAELCEMIEHNLNCESNVLILKVVNSELSKEDQEEILNLLDYYLANHNKKPLFKYADDYISSLVELMQEAEADEARNDI